MNRVSSSAHARHALRRLIPAARFLSAGLLIFAPCGRASEASQPQLVSARAGLVTRVDGEVLRRRGGAGDAQTLRKGATLDDGDVVVTAEKGHADWSLTPDSYVHVSGNAYLRAYETEFDRMHFDIERGEVLVVVRSLESGVSLVIHAPPGLITVRKAGRYLFRVAANGDTEAVVGKKGELRYRDERGADVSLKKGMSVNFRGVGKRASH